MRLRKRDQRAVVFKSRIPLKDNDGTSYEGWDPTGTTIYGNVQPAGGKVMAEMYGERLAYMLIMYVEGSPSIEESSGAWVNIDTSETEPDYKVVAVRPWGAHIVIDLEKVRA